ncbi:MAG TPA: vitamin K epoxide reductase family protein [Candidatus Solibacter sp.]|nr:vitamin K epoxide reductase family protein [Candidatus Solibacter sp.]
MRWVIILVALGGLVASSLALREHHRVGSAPCDINEKWDCGTVNKSQFAVIGGIFEHTGPDVQPSPRKGILSAIANIPVADVGIAGYLLLALLAFKRWWPALAAASVVALGFSLYLAHIEKDVLGVWCIYCVISLGAISVITLLSLVALGINLRKKTESPQG